MFGVQMTDFVGMKSWVEQAKVENWKQKVAVMPDVSLRFILLFAFKLLLAFAQRFRELGILERLA